MPSPYQFTYFQGGGFDCSLLSFLQIDARRQRQRLASSARGRTSRPACGGFVDITARAKRIVFSGYFTAGAQARGRATASSRSCKEGKVKKLVPRGRARLLLAAGAPSQQGQDITYVTERCVMRADAGRPHRHRDRARRSISSATCWRRPRSRCKVACRPADDGRAAVPPRADRARRSPDEPRRADASASRSTARSRRSRSAGRRSSTR